MTTPEPPVRPTDAETADRLRGAPFEPIGRFADASNATLLVRLTDRDPRTHEDLAADLGRDPALDDVDPVDLAVYKPRRGAAPLWDFPAGTLHQREVAAYEISAALGWDLVPVTVLVDDGPFGVGSLQRFVPHDPTHHYFHLLDHGDEDVIDQLRAMVVLDAVIDNADRKGGHVLLEHPVTTGSTGGADAGDAGDAADAEPLLSGRIQLVDHGVSFNVEDKLRTVGWHFAGEPVPEVLRADVVRLGQAVVGGPLGERLAGLLAPEEVAVLLDRIARVAELTRFPEPSGRHPFPWPML
ncbi:hypothetical protein [Nitriliruptor alkaliphilus]|uniref:hypothetical protein n=1 Tax=Nitriliruptor alkaliphilus TaxID=427918 RepID=UPI0006985BD2|nr:hypothetical protein [Nitriliruptor alkaliphilus]